MKDSKDKSAQTFIQLLEIVEKLHGPQGCPWDQEQNHKSLRPYVIEEAYEVVHAIDTENMEHLKEELGDLLLQVLFHSILARKENKFDLADVMEGIAKKLIHRHPHVFSNVPVKDSAEVIKNWEQIKNEEKKPRSHSSLLSEIPFSFPALLKAYKLGKKASQVGFDWPELKGVFEKIKEEIKELEISIESKNEKAVREEMGDLLFSLANLSRFLKVNPEEALRQTNEKFIQRFQFIEVALQKDNKSFKDATLEQLNSLWNEAKKKEIKNLSPSQ